MKTSSYLGRFAAAGAALTVLLTGCTSSSSVKDPTPVAGATTFSSLRIGISFDQPGIGVATAGTESNGVTTGTDPKGFDVDTATYVAKALGVQPTSITWVKADPVDRENLIRFSPIHKLDQIRVPLFIAQGFDDPRVPPGESEMVYSVLRGLGRPVEYVRIPHEGHGFARIENRRTVFGGVARFLREHL